MFFKSLSSQFNETPKVKSIQQTTFTEGQKCQDGLVYVCAKQRSEKSCARAISLANQIEERDPFYLMFLRRQNIWVGEYY